MTLGPNDVEPCGTRARRVHHAAKAQLCVVCDPALEWMTRCPVCLDRVPAVGVRLTAHEAEGTETVCPGGGTTVPAPPLLDRPIWPRAVLDQPWRRRVDRRVWNAVGA